MHRRTIQRIIGGTLHVTLENWSTISCLDASQLRSHFHARQRTGYHVSIFLNLGNHAALAQEQIIIIRAGSRRYIITRLTCQGDDIVLPYSRAVFSENNCRVDSLTDSLHNPRSYLAEDIKLRIVQYCFRDRHDNCQLRSIQIHVVPCLAAGLLHAGIAVYPVRSRQEIQYADSGLVAGHIRQFLCHAHKGGLLRRVLKYMFYDLLADDRLCIRSVNDIRCHKLPP